MNRNDVSPAVWHYGLAVLVIVIGFAAFAGFMYQGISNMQNDLLQMKAPSTAELNLSEAGEYTIFYENKSYLNGTIYNTDEEIPNLHVSLKEMATGNDLAVHASSESLTYSIGDRSGRSIMAFEVARPGIYQVNASYSGSEGPQVVLAIGKGMAEGMLSSIIFSIAALVLSIAIAAAIVYTTYRKRKKAFSKIIEEESMIRGG
ncbi:MAG: hypothetical protein PHF80_04110 [Methanothrix sp.]|nr:hypothetical protein [Methanothrix sp.]